MVIPLGGMGGPTLFGPPPAVVQGRFLQIKYCVLALFASVVGQFVAYIMLGAGIAAALMASLNLILNGVFGIFLLRDDPLLGRAHHCLSTTVFGACREQCGGGMQCLQPFILVNIVTVVLNLILNPADLAFVVKQFHVLLEPAAWPNPLWGFAYLLMAVSTLAAYTSQIAGAFIGWQAYKVVRDMGTSSTPRTWAPAGGYPMASEGNDAPARESQPAPGFQAFHGGGNRLGSN